MTWLPDSVLRHLRDVVDAPDLTGTRYRLLERIGRGGMGTVYLAEDTALERKVALKVLSAPDPTGELAARLLREARILARLEHPNIVPVHDVGTLPDGRVFCVMKWVRGKRLDAWVREGSGDGPPPARPAVLRLFQHACEAMAFAHAHGVIHRDLKPENIMVGEYGEALVMDWGIAKELAGPEEPALPPVAPVPRGVETVHGAIIGTPAWMSPEQARGEVHRIDARTDVYALGTLLRFLLGDEPAPPPLRSICARATAPEPEQRFASARELAADVGRYLDGLEVESHRESLPERLGRWGRRHQTLLLLLAAYLAMRVAVIFAAGR